MSYLYAINRPTIPAPKGEAEIFQLYGWPGNYKDSQAYWKEVAVFCFINGEAFSHVPFLRNHCGFWTNKNARNAFEAAFESVVQKGLSKEVISFDGCYVDRLVRGGTRLSLHALGAAIDMNAAQFPLGSKKRFSDEFVKCFTDLGFTYGGDYKGRKDGMHMSFGEY